MKDKKILYIIIGVIICLLLGLGGLFVYREFDKKDDPKESEINNKDDDPAAYDEVTTDKIDFVNTGTYQIKLNNKKINVVLTGDGPHREVTIGNDKLDIPFEYVDKLYVINNEIILITRSNEFYDELYFYDSGLKNIGFTFEQKYVMKISSITRVEDNKIYVNTINELLVNNFDDISKICEDVNIEEYKTQLSKAEYEIEYSGGHFHKPKLVQPIEYISDICKS